MKKFFCVLIIELMVIAALPFRANAQAPWRSALLKYINSKLQKPDGGYGWEDQYDSHTTVCFAVTGILNDIDALPRDKARLAEFIRTHHPQRGPNKEAGPSGSDLRNLTYEQIQAILWLGGDVTSFAKEVAGWKSQQGLLANYEEHKYAVMYQEAMIPIVQELVKVPLTDLDQYIGYYQTHRRANGSYNNAPAAAGGDGNILNTYWALYALRALGVPSAGNNEAIAWLQSCQLQNGGFTHQPKPQIGVYDDVMYTWAGVKALQLLGGKPKNVQAVVKYLVSLRNADGGFGNRPGLHSTPTASFYAIDALKILDGFAALGKAPAPQLVKETKPDFSGYKVYTVQFEASGNGSPAEAVMLAKQLHIDMWGVKNEKPGWITAAQKLANERKVPVTFFVSDEPYNGSVNVPGMGSFEHILDYIAPGDRQIKFKDSITFDEFKRSTLQSVKQVDGGLLLQVANNEPMARMLLDEAINTKLGYIGISTIHFGQNFAFWLPYIMDYRYRLPLVTLQDAHGIESWWWTDELTSHRNLFIARKPTYNELMTAFRNHWITGVRHDSISDFKTRMLGGTDAARHFITSKEGDWKWWTTPQNLLRPQVAITVVSTNDVFDAGKPDTGLNIRIRCRWNNVREALKSALTTLQELKVDGQVVKAEEVITKGKRGVADAYYIYKWDSPAKGEHKIEAAIKDAVTQTTKTYTETYTQK